MPSRPLSFGSLFTGIGGFDLGFERAGMVCEWQVEIDKYARKVLRKHWPDVRRVADIKKFPPAPIDLWKVDVICGGFPCQDISIAGKQEGIHGTRSGLWFEMARVVRILRPKYVVVENVTALFANGFGEVLGSLAACGYDAEWCVLSAAQFGGLHQRERVFIVAYDRQKRGKRFFPKKIPRFKRIPWCENVGGLADLRNRSDVYGPLLRRNSNGVPDQVDQLGCLGNAVVPQIAEYIGELLNEHVSDDAGWI